MTVSEGLLRAKEIEAYETLQSLDQHGELIRLILAEVSLLADRYRYVQRHDVPHVRELTGLVDLLWQEVRSTTYPPGEKWRSDALRVRERDASGLPP